MTQSVGKAAAKLDIVGDFSTFAANLKRDADRALAKVNLNADPVAKQIGTSFDKGAAKATAALRGLSTDAGRHLDHIGADADKAGSRISREFEASAKRAAAALRATEAEAAAAGKQAGRSFGTSVVAGAGVVLATGLAQRFFAGAIGEANEAAKVTALTAAAIKSTGGAANVSALQIGHLAGALSDLSGVDDEVIQSSENVLLTFTRVKNSVGKGNDIFDQATAAALDMSAALGTDLQGSIILVGKSLNEPLTGLTALRRAGVQFTDAQKEQIATMVEAGDVMGAQKIILGELTTQFGGAAAAAATPADKARVAWGNLQEELGTKLLPTLNSVLEFGIRNQQWVVPLAIALTELAVVIGAVVLAQKTWNAVNSVLGVGLEGSAVKAKRAAVGFGALLVVAQAVGSAFAEHIVPQIDALQKDLIVFANTGQVSAEMLRILGGEADDLGRNLSVLSEGWLLTASDAVADFGASLFGATGPAAQAKESIAAMDTALAGLVQSGQSELAAAAFKKVWEEAQKQGVTLDQLQAAFPEYVAAAQHTVGAQDDLADATKKAADAGQELISTWNELNGAMITADQAMLDAVLAVANVKEVFESGGTSIKGNSQAALENKIALEKAAAAAVEAAARQIEMGGSAAQAAAEVERLKNEAIKNTGATGANAASVKELANQLFRIPPNVSSTVTLTEIRRNIVEYQTYRAGERQADGGLLRFYATGGLEQHVAQVVKAGTMRVWGEPETGGEAYIPLAPGKRQRSMAILSQVAALFGYDLVNWSTMMRPGALPRIPMLAAGAITRTPTVMPTTGPDRARQLAEESGLDKLLGEVRGGGGIQVRVFIGTREITDIIDVQIEEHDRLVESQVTSGSGRRR